MFRPGVLRPKHSQFQLCSGHPMTGKGRVNELDESMMHHIWKFLNKKDLARCMAVCREWGRLIPDWYVKMTWYRPLSVVIEDSQINPGRDPFGRYMTTRPKYPGSGQRVNWEDSSSDETTPSSDDEHLQG